MSPLSTIELAPILKRLTANGATFDEKRLMRAYIAAQEAYCDQIHWTGESVLKHAIGALEELAKFEPDEDAVIACILHHVLKEKRMTLQELEEQFGPKVRSLVSGLHLLTYVTLEGRRSSIEDLRLVLLSVSDDVRVILITLCTWTYVLRFLDRVAPEQARRMCRDMLQLFAPVAARLGIYTLKHDLESGAFPFVYPDDALQIQEQMEQVHEDHVNFLARAQASLEAFFKEQGIKAYVEAREKLPYSVFLKMQKKSITHVQELYDLFALRVVVKSEEDCYQVLGLLHRMGRPVSNRFKDYIAFPKPNGYQSLHTTLSHFNALPDDLFVEVQIRTEEMHREANFGVAAHWSYKEYGAAAHAMESVQLQSMLLSQEQVRDGEESHLVDHIFVLTPKGDIVELPEGATPLDFAFQVHTDLGLSFRAARVNGSIAPLDFELQNGDVIEIQKYGTPKASPEWMHLLRMASSRSKLKRYLYSQRHGEFMVKGRGMLNAELLKRGLPQLTSDLGLLRKCGGNVLAMQEREDLLVKIGQENERASALLPRLDLLEGKIKHEPTLASKKPALATIASDKEVEIDGGLSMPYRFAKCCHPEEFSHEPVEGVISRGGKVIVHRATCGMLDAANPDRCVGVTWKS